MALAPNTLNMGDGYIRKDIEGATIFVKANATAIDSNAFVWLPELRSKTGIKLRDAAITRASTVAELSKSALAYDSTSGQALTDILSSLNKAKTAIVNDASADSQYSTQEMSRLQDRQKIAIATQNDAAKIDKNINLPEPKEEQVATDAQKAAKQQSVDKAQSDGIDPVTGQPTDGSTSKITPSTDSSAINTFADDRKKYLTGNLDTDPLVIFESTSVGSIDKALGLAMFGISNTKAPPNLPMNKDKKGYVFFTRPQLNLQDFNIANFRKFYPLLNDNPTSIQRQIRCLLDPRLQWPLTILDIPGETKFSSKALMKKIGYNPDPIESPFVDPLNPFISILTNTCESMSGFPDVALNTFSSKPGMHKQSYVQFDDIAKTSETIDIECTFKNIISDPITWLFYVWTWYGSLVFDGTLMPYMDYVGENWIDYQTRIWRLVMDPSDTVVTKIAATGPSIPISMPLGSFFDFDNETPYNTQNKSLSVRFRCMGVETLDEILVDDFNRTSMMFNENFRPENKMGTMVKVPAVYRMQFSGLAYPYINPDNYHLEWWTQKETYERVIDMLKFTGTLGANL